MHTIVEKPTCLYLTNAIKCPYVGEHNRCGKAQCKYGFQYDASRLDESAYLMKLSARAVLIENALRESNKYTMEDISLFVNGKSTKEFEEWFTKLIF